MAGPFISLTSECKCGHMLGTHRPPPAKQKCDGFNRDMTDCDCEEFELAGSDQKSA